MSRMRGREVHPTTLLFAIVAWVWGVYLLHTLAGLAVYLGGAVAVQLLLAPRQQSAVRMIRSLAAIGLMIVLFAVISALFATGTGRVLWQGPHISDLGTLQLTSGSVTAGFQRALRIWALLLGVAAFAARVRPDDVTVWLGRWFSRAGLTLSMIMTFLPMVQRERQRLTEFVWARAGFGQGRKQSWLDGVRAAAVVVQALLANALERSWTLAESMYVRGYTASGRTLYRRASWSRFDVGMLAGLLVVIPVTGAAGVLDHTGNVTLAAWMRTGLSGWIWVIIIGGLGVRLRGHRAN